MELVVSFDEIEDDCVHYYWTTWTIVVATCFYFRSSLRNNLGQPFYPSWGGTLKGGGDFFSDLTWGGGEGGMFLFWITIE